MLIEFVSLLIIFEDICTRTCVVQDYMQKTELFKFSNTYFGFRKDTLFYETGRIEFEVRIYSK